VGPITRAQALEILPFCDRLFSAPYKGEEIIEFFKSLKLASLNHLPYFYGLRVIFSQGSIISLQNLFQEDIDPASTYTLATSGQMTRIMGPFGPHPARLGYMDHGTIADAFIAGLKRLTVNNVCQAVEISDISDYPYYF
jgi:hypothetical protein